MGAQTGLSEMAVQATSRFGDSQVITKAHGNFPDRDSGESGLRSSVRAFLARRPYRPAGSAGPEAQR